MNWLAKIGLHLRLNLLLLQQVFFRKDKREAIVSMGLQEVRQGDFSALFYAVDRAGGVDGCKPSTAAKAALAYQEAGRNAEARRLLEDALKKWPEDGLVLSGYGSCLVAEGRFQEGVAYLTKGLAQRPKDPWLLSCLGAAYYGLNQWAESRRFYLESIQNNPQGLPLGLLYSFAAHAEAQLGLWPEAASHWREAAVLLPKDGEIGYNLGDALLHAGDYRGAIEALMQSLRLGDSARPA
jgi:tetratricopeptide (TPR) repeat protein